MEILGFEFTILQIALIVALLLVVPIGFFNMRKKNKQKKQEENLYSNYNPEPSQEGYPEDVDESDEESQQIIAYINSYKNEYSRESVSSALINNGNDSEKVNRLVNRYY